MKEGRRKGFISKTVAVVVVLSLSSFYSLLLDFFLLYDAVVEKKKSLE
jgi:hypothetical protein